MKESFNKKFEDVTYQDILDLTAKIDNAQRSTMPLRPIYYTSSTATDEEVRLLKEYYERFGVVVYRPEIMKVPFWYRLKMFIRIIFTGKC